VFGWRGCMALGNVASMSQRRLCLYLHLSLAEFQFQTAVPSVSPTPALADYRNQKERKEDTYGVRSIAVAVACLCNCIIITYRIQVASLQVACSSTGNSLLIWKVADCSAQCYPKLAAQAAKPCVCC
jgi:hypothetical protein